MVILHDFFLIHFVVLKAWRQLKKGLEESTGNSEFLRFHSHQYFNLSEGFIYFEKRESVNQVSHA